MESPKGFRYQKTALDAPVEIQGESYTVGSLWDTFVGGQSAADFLAQDARPIAEQCREYAAWAATNVASDDDGAPAWTDGDTDALADALARYIAFDTGAGEP